MDVIFINEHDFALGPRQKPGMLLDVQTTDGAHHYYQTHFSGLRLRSTVMFRRALYLVSVQIGDLLSRQNIRRGEIKKVSTKMLLYYQAMSDDFVDKPEGLLDRIKASFGFYKPPHSTVVARAIIKAYEKTVDADPI